MRLSLVKLAGVFLIVLLGVVSSQATDTTIDSTKTLEVACDSINQAGKIVLTPDQSRKLAQVAPNQLLYIQPGVAVIRNNHIYYFSNPVFPPEIHVRGGRHYYSDYYFNGMSMRDPFTGVLSATFIPEVQRFGFVAGNNNPSYGDALSGIFTFDTPPGGEKLSGMIDLKTDNLYSTSFDHNYYTAAFSGPLIDPDIATFSIVAKRTYFGDKNPSPKTNELYGVDQLPDNSFSGWAISGRVDFDLTPKLSGNFIYDGSFNKYQDYLHEFNNPYFPEQIEHTPRYETDNYAYSFNWFYQLSERDRLSLSAGYLKAESKAGDGVLFDNLEAYADYYPYSVYDQFSLFREGEEDAVYEPSIYTRYTHHISSNYRMNLEYLREINDMITVTTGLTYKKYTVRNYDNLQVGYDADHLTINYGFDSYDNQSDDLTFLNDAKKPSIISLYSKAIFSLDNMIIIPGIRLDRYNYDALTFKNINMPFTPDGLTQYPEEYSLEESDMREVSSRYRLSEMLKFIIPLSESFQYLFAYRNIYQMQPFQYLYNDWNFAEQRILAGSYYPFGNADIDPEHSQQVEMGASLFFGRNSSLSVTGYYNNFDNQLYLGHISSVYPSVYDMYANLSESKAKGAMFALSVQENEDLSFDLIVELSKSTGFYSYPLEYRRIYFTPAPNENKSLTYDQTYRIYGKINYVPQNIIDLTLFGSYLDGKPYSPGLVYKKGDHFLPTGATNSVEYDSYFEFDLHLEKKIQLGEINLIPYLTVVNILDEKIINNVYPATGLPDDTGLLDTEEGQQMAQDPEFLERYQIWQANPRHYNSPRQIFTGIRISF